MARTKSMWALSALSTGVLGHTLPLKANYTNTAPKVPHPYWWEGPYSVSLIETPSIAASAIPLPTFPSPEDELYGTRSSTAPPPITSGPCETEYAIHYPPVPVTTGTIGYGSASSLEPSSAVEHASSSSLVYASLPAYPTSAGVKSNASTLLPPSYTMAIPHYPSDPVNSTRLPHSYTIAIPLPLSSTAQETTSSFKTSSGHCPSSSVSSKTQSSVPSHNGTAVLTPSTTSSSSAYTTDIYSASEPNTMLSSDALSSTTIVISLSLPQSSISTSFTSPSNSQGYATSSISLPKSDIPTGLVTSSPVTMVIPVPPFPTSSIVPNTSSASSQSIITLSSATAVPSSITLSSASTSTVLEVSTRPTLSLSATYTVIVSFSSQSLPTSSLETSILPSSILPVHSSIMTVVPSSWASAYLSTSNTIESVTSDGASSIVPASTLQEVSSVPPLSTIDSSSAASPTVNPTFSSTLSITQTTRPTAAGSSVRYTLSTSAARGSSVPAQTNTGVPPAPPVQTGAAKTLGSSDKEIVWWVSFLLPFMLCL